MTARGPVPDARVLVVDDDPGNRTLMMRTLTGEGYTAEPVADGAAALAAIKLRPPDLVLLDVAMPGIDGFEVCRAIKADPATMFVPVVLVTGMNDRAHKIAGIEAGADDFLGKPFDAQELKARARSLIRLKRSTDDLETAETVINSLALTIEARDSYTEGHCHRLSVYAVALGRELALSREEIDALQRGGYLHDVGKIGIPDHVLLKPGPLTPDEYALMQQHTVIGDRLCGGLRSLRLVRSIVRSHHERLDGTGYPDGLRGDAIPLLAQIVSVADVYDAMTTDRPYRPAYSPEAALEQLRTEGTLGWRRPDLVSTFIALCEKGQFTGLAPGPRIAT